MILITNREDIDDAYKIRDVQDIKKLITMKRELQYCNSSSIYVDNTVSDSDKEILTSFFGKFDIKVRNF